ncbi:hypothetical protein ACJX0J_019145, partial [Zea mays]
MYNQDDTTPLAISVVFAFDFLFSIFHWHASGKNIYRTIRSCIFDQYIGADIMHHGRDIMKKPANFSLSWKYTDNKEYPFCLFHVFIFPAGFSSTYYVCQKINELTGLLKQIENYQTAPVHSMETVKGGPHANANVIQQSLKLSHTPNVNRDLWKLKACAGLFRSKKILHRGRESWQGVHLFPFACIYICLRGVRGH